MLVSVGKDAQQLLENVLASDTILLTILLYITCLRLGLLWTDPHRVALLGMTTS